VTIKKYIRDRGQDDALMGKKEVLKPLVATDQAPSKEAPQYNPDGFGIVDGEVPKPYYYSVEEEKFYEELAEEKAFDTEAESFYKALFDDEEDEIKRDMVRRMALMDTVKEAEINSDGQITKLYGSGKAAQFKPGNDFYDVDELFQR
jgi:hypothetical protein